MIDLNYEIQLLEHAIAAYKAANAARLDDDALRTLSAAVLSRAADFDLRTRQVPCARGAHCVALDEDDGAGLAVLPERTCSACRFGDPRRIAESSRWPGQSICGECGAASCAEPGGKCTEPGCTGTMIELMGAIPVIVTTHLTLDESQRQEFPIACMDYDEYGWIFYVGDWEESIDEPENWPGLVAICKWASTIGASWVRLDRDAEAAPGLPLYDW